MNELQFSDEVMDRIRVLDGCYHERAYFFVLSALEYRQQQLPAVPPHAGHGRRPRARERWTALSSAASMATATRITIP